MSFNDMQHLNQINKYKTIQTQKQQHKRNSKATEHENIGKHKNEI